MNHLRKCLSGLVCAALVLPLAGRAHDVISPCWRGQPDTTFADWRFDTSANPTSPEASVNAYGPPSASVTVIPSGAGWISQLGGFGSQSNFWSLGPAGDVTVSIPNKPGVSPDSSKFVWVQTTEFIDNFIYFPASVSIPGASLIAASAPQLVEAVGSPSVGWFVYQSLWRLDPSPSTNSVTVTAGIYDSLIDQIVVDTICITNPDTYVDVNYSGPDCTLVGWPNSVAPLDKPLNLLAFASFQMGVDTAPAGGTVSVAAGTYAAVNINKPVTVNLGAPTAQATVAGLTLGASSTLAMDINGQTPGTQHDQWVVNGAVNLGGAALALTSGTTLALNDTIILINNDASDAVAGTFAGLPEGSTNLIGGQQFKISYSGGTGNDVVLTMVNHSPIPGSKLAETYQDIPATMYVSKLLEIASDPDVGDTVSFVAPVSPSVQNGSVTSTTLNGVPSITYTPPSGFSGSDSFYYTLTDGKVTVTGSVAVTVRPASAMTFNMLPLEISNGVPFVRFAGVAGYGYTLQRSPDLVTWTSLTNIALPLPPAGNGIGEFMDVSAPNTNAFYRTRYP
jgi:hypothetical protein